MKNRKDFVPILVGTLACFFMYTNFSARQRGSSNHIRVNVSVKPQLIYSVMMPDNLKKEMVLHHKDGSEEFCRDTHSVYRQWHKAGWSACLEDYSRGRMTDSSYPAAKCCFSFQQQGERDGYDFCRRSIRAYEKEYGAERTVDRVHLLIGESVMQRFSSE